MNDMKEVRSKIIIACDGTYDVKIKVDGEFRFFGNWQTLGKAEEVRDEALIRLGIRTH